MAFQMIYVTFPGKKAAKKIINELLDGGLIACANIFESESIYLWMNKKETSKEASAIIKTDKSKASEVEKKIRKLHPYDVPAIIRLNATANKEYEKWIAESVKK
jgi:periplasmic divalent cation tolerance protein